MWQGGRIAVPVEELPKLKKLAAMSRSALKILREMGYILAPDGPIGRLLEGREAPRGKPGRRKTTGYLAEFAAARRPHATWEEILREYKALYPEDQQVKSLQTIREAYRRHFLGKGKEPKSQFRPKSFCKT